MRKLRGVIQNFQRALRIERNKVLRAVILEKSRSVWEVKIQRAKCKKKNQKVGLNGSKNHVVGTKKWIRFETEKSL